jgi:hypothetical protein
MHSGESEPQLRDPADLPEAAFRAGCPLEKTGSAYFFIKSSTAAVIATIPVRIVGSGTGANLLE